VFGALDVLAVVIAVELLGKRDAFAGYLTTAVGVGSLLAGSIAFALIGRRWIAPWILISGLVVGGALVAVDRQPFLTAVTGHAATRARASSIAIAHLDPP
jgi:Na+-transporting NADH:ubiquinone oxidoreductase subunit NqrB